MEKIIDKKLLKHLLTLARLDLEKEKQEKILADLGEILNYLKEIDKAETENIEPFLGAAFQKNVFREDTQKESLKEKEECLKQAPQLEQGHFKVPKVK